MQSEQLSYELYKWLSPLEVLPTNLRYKSNGNFQLDTKSSEGLMNGSFIAKLLMKLAQNVGGVLNEPLLSSIKQSNTPAAKVYNWNILAESFMKLNVNISKQTQKQITSGNFSTLVRFLLELHKKFNPKKEKKQSDRNHEINLKKLQVLQSYSQAQTFLQMVIMIISQSLSLTPKQTVSTLSQNAKYYAHMVVKGIKGGFLQIAAMIDTFSKQMSNLMYLCEKSPEKNTQFFLDLIKPTLISRQAEIAKKGAGLFKNFLQESLKYNSKNLIYQILSKEGVGFDFLYMALKRHPDLSHQFTAFLYPLIKDAFKDFFEVHLKRTINNQQQQLKILLKILDGLTSNSQSKAKLKQSGMIDIWLKNSQQSFNNKKKKEQNLINEETKLIYLQLLCNLWKEYSSEINQQEAEQLLMKGIQELKKNARRQIYTIKIPALLRLFDFLHYLADCKNKVAAILYKKLIFLFIESHEQQEIRQIILTNFIIMLRKYPTIPIDFLLDPLLKQLINSQGKTYILNVFDFQFLLELCKHPRMDAAFGLSYLEYLSKLYIKQFIYSKLVIRLIEVLTNRFCEQETIIEFLKKNVESTLNLYGILAFNKKKLSKENTIINKQKKSLAIELIKHFIQLQHQELNQFILQKITTLFSKWVQERNYNDKGLKYLINLFGDVQQIVLHNKLQQNRRFAGVVQQTEQTIEVTSNENKHTPKSQSYKQLQYMKERGIGYKATRKTSKTRMEEIVDKNVKPDPKVLKNIETLKQKIKDQANKKKQQHNNQMKKLNQQNNINSIELLQRNLSLGYAKLTPLQEDTVLFNFDSVKQKQLKMSIKFHTLSELQEQDSKSVQVILKQYSKEIKSLFQKYALISAQLRKDENNPIMSFTEVIKMIKQKNIGNINKLVISDMIASINFNKRKQKNVLSGLQEPEFNQFLIKLTDYMIQEQKNSLEVPFGLKLQVILKNLLQGEIFYQNKFRSKQPQNIIKLRQLINNEEQVVQIPQGYKRIKETQVDLQYKLNDNDWGINQKYQMGYQIADWLISKCLGFHIMTPNVQINQKYNLIQIPKPIKPKIPKQQTDNRIKYQPENKDQAINPSPNIAENNFVSVPNDKEKKNSAKAKQGIKNQRRSLSHRAINKTKTDPIQQTQQQKQKKLKQLKYAEKLKQNLQRLRQEKNTKQQAEKLKQLEFKQKEKKKQQERKKYLEENKEKIKQQKIKEEQQKQQKLNQEKQLKEKQKQEFKAKEQAFLDKQKQAIKQKAEKISERKKELQNSRQKKIQNLQKLAKQVVNSKNDNNNDRLKMIQVKNSLQNGSLKDVINKFQKPMNQLFESYWAWDKKRIDLNSFALIFKDFHLSPELVYPKILAQTYKTIARGQNLDFEGFKECLMKCAYRSQKLSQQYPSEGQQQTLNVEIANTFLQKLRMNEQNYKQIIKQVKKH